MSEPQYFDDGLENLFTRAAAETDDHGFTSQVMTALERRDRTRTVAVAAAGLAGTAIAATQLGGLRTLVSSLGEQASAAFGAAPQAEGILSENVLAGGSPMAMVAVGLAFLALAGIAALVRR